ncbi:hypothetical protein GGI21_002562 [Coemansia aciculifera]|nr:hypothetical protein GGI21_002562 [Coemansia aciculifera]
MLVQLREVGSSESDAGAVVVDPTGEMRVSIHHAVMRRVAFPLAAGTSIILHSVAAVKMAGWPPFLVITGGTIEQIFTVKSAGTREDPIVVEDTQKSTLRTAAPAAVVAATQPAADVDDSALDLSLFDDDNEGTDIF